MVFGCVKLEILGGGVLRNLSAYIIIAHEDDANQPPVAACNNFNAALRA